MSLFKKIKFMEYNNLPSETSDDEIYAVQFDLGGWNNAPNYGAIVGLSKSTTYTVGSGPLANYTKGYFMTGAVTRCDDSAPAIYVNGHGAIVMGYDHDYGGDLSGYCCFIPVKTGDSFSIDNISAYGSTNIAWFIPTKGF